MARVGGGGGPRWVWPLIIVLILVGLALLALAFLAPAAPAPQPNEAQNPAATSTGAGSVSIADITGDPSAYYEKQVTVDGRVTRRVGEQGLYVVDSAGGIELLAVLDKSVDSSELRNDDVVRISGAIFQVTPDEVTKLSDSLDKPTLDAMTNENVYLWATTYEKTSP